jgi:hypothetical protein
VSRPWTAFISFERCCWSIWRFRELATNIPYDTTYAIQGTFSEIQGRFSKIQGTFDEIQGTFSEIQGIISEIVAAPGAGHEHPIGHHLCNTGNIQ